MARLTLRSGYHRLSTHGFVLAGVIGVALASPPVYTPSAELRMARASDAQLSSTQPARVELEMVALVDKTAAPDTAMQPTQGPLMQTLSKDDQRLAVRPFDPRLGLPQWLRVVRETTLWSSADTSATATFALPAGSTYLKPLGPFVNTRVQVYFPGDSERSAASAWIETTSVEPSGIPPWIAPPLAAQDPAPPLRVSDTPAPDTSALHVAIIDDSSGQLLYAERANTQVPQASTTKIVTAIVALERTADLGKRIKVNLSASAMAARDGSSTMGIEPGQTVSLTTLLHGMMLPSGNDAAEQIALALADSREQYVEWMNQEAAALGLKDTHFVNPSGMDAPGHYSSAYDMAMLARYAMRNSTFRELAKTRQYVAEGFRMQNLNRLLDVYPGTDGVKIGYTDAAQKTVVASATRDGHRVYVSLMHSEDLVGDCSQLFNWVWDSFAW